MNFYEKIKSDFMDQEKRRGLRKQVIVDSRALYKLLEDYEILDAHVRNAQTYAYIDMERRLFNSLKEAYLRIGHSDKLLLLIMDFLRPMIEEKLKRTEIENIFSR